MTEDREQRVAAGKLRGWKAGRLGGWEAGKKRR
jgi:hypothetical protein